MRIFNSEKTQEILNPDLTLGLLYPSTITTHIPYSAPVAEVGHQEIIREYPNGGKDAKWVIDVEGKPEIPEHDEVENILIYREFTEKEKAEREILELKSYLSETDWVVVKCMEMGLIPSSAYPEITTKRTEARERINTLESTFNIGE